MGKKKAKKEKPAFDDYEYGYGYDYLLDDEEQKKPTDTADDADGPEEKVLARIREFYREDYDAGREYKPDDEAIDIPLENLLLDGVVLELKLKPEEKEELEETEGRKLLQRELREEALRRYEESARTVQDFKNIPRSIFEKCHRFSIEEYIGFCQKEIFL